MLPSSPTALAALFALQGSLAGAFEQLQALGSRQAAEARRSPALTPAFVVGQAGAFASTLLYNALLPLGDLSRADPTSRAFFLLSSTAAELSLGGSYDLRLLAPGLVLLVAGAWLCSGA